MPSRQERTASGGVRADRAAQFIPFAALTGYYDLVREEERLINEEMDDAPKRSAEARTKRHTNTRFTSTM